MRCPTVFVQKGKISLDEPSNCTFFLEDFNSSCVQDITVPGRWYGIVNYECNGLCNGKLVSSYPECDECELCIHNELIPKCRSQLTAYVLSGSIGFIIAVLTYIAVLSIVRMSRRRQWWRKLNLWWTSYQERTEAKKEEKTAIRFRRYRDRQLEEMLKERINLKGNLSRGEEETHESIHTSLRDDEITGSNKLPVAAPRRDLR